MRSAVNNKISIKHRTNQKIISNLN